MVILQQNLLYLNINENIYGMKLLVEKFEINFFLIYKMKLKKKIELFLRNTLCINLLKNNVESIDMHELEEEQGYIKNIKLCGHNELKMKLNQVMVMLQMKGEPEIWLMVEYEK